MNDRDVEITRQRQRCEKAEATLRNANMDIERYREEIRLQRIELQAAEDRAKKACMDSELARQREVTRRAEMRLANMGRRASSQPPVEEMPDRRENGLNAADRASDRNAYRDIRESHDSRSSYRGRSLVRESRPPTARAASVPLTVSTVEDQLDREVLAESLAMRRNPAWCRPDQDSKPEQKTRKPMWIPPNNPRNPSTERPSQFPPTRTLEDDSNNHIRSSNTSITSAPSLGKHSQSTYGTSKELTRIGAKYGLGGLDRLERSEGASLSTQPASGESPARPTGGSLNTKLSASGKAVPSSRTEPMLTPDSADGSATTKRRIQSSADSLADPTPHTGSHPSTTAGGSLINVSIDRSVSSVQSLVQQRYERLQAMYDRVTGGKDRMSWRDSESEGEDD